MVTDDKMTIDYHCPPTVPMDFANLRSMLINSQQCPYVLISQWHLVAKVKGLTMTNVDHDEFTLVIVNSFATGATKKPKCKDTDGIEKRF